MRLMTAGTSPALKLLLKQPRLEILRADSSAWLS